MKIKSKVMLKFGGSLLSNNVVHQHSFHIFSFFSPIKHKVSDADDSNDDDEFDVDDDDADNPGTTVLVEAWGAHKGQDDVSSPRMSGDDDDHHNQGDHHCVE